MANLNKKYSADIKGIVSIEDDKIFMEVEDIPDPVSLADFFADFDGKYAKITIGYSEEADGKSEDAN